VPISVPETQDIQSGMQGSFHVPNPLYRFVSASAFPLNQSSLLPPHPQSVSPIMPTENRARSVNDFDTSDGLRSALKHTEKRESFVDFGRDFPRALIGSSLGIPRDDDSQSECSTVFEPDSELDWMLTNYNQETSNRQSLDEELTRLQVLKSYLILDSEREANFERLTALAARMFHVPIALVSLVDLGRQWFMSNRGLGDVRETPRNLAFCAHAIISKEDLLIVPDATKDSRFKDNPLVTGPPHIRFYGGAPLLCPEGYKLGTLCLIDSKVRPEGLSLEDRQTLRELAALVVDAMVERRREKMSVLQDKSQIIATTAHDLLTPLSGIEMSMSLLMEDEELKKKLTSNHKELIETASACANVMHRICNEAIETFRGDVNRHNRRFTSSSDSSDPNGMKTIVVSELVKNLNMVMEPFPKKVPLFISVDPLVPPEFSVPDDLKIFRATINYLTNALKKTEQGNVRKCS
jgi:GAF domain-containing protein